MELKGLVLVPHTPSVLCVILGLSNFSEPTIKQELTAAILPLSLTGLSESKAITHVKIAL